MFTTIIVQPIFNLLVLIYALIPGHNFGLTIIIFTVVIRLLMWPLVKKQLNQARAMRELAPEIKKIKAATKGDRQKESTLTMELYKEKEINPFATVGILLVQLPILIGLYSSVRRMIYTPKEILTFSYPALHHLSWLHTLSGNINRFDDTLFGVVNLGRKAIDTHGLYWPALLIVTASAVAQFYQSRQLMPRDPQARSLRHILKEAGKGNSADQSEVNAAVARGTQFMIPGFVFLFGLNFEAALPLYWLTGSLVAVIQQGRVLRKDVEQAEDQVDRTDKTSRVKVESTLKTVKQLKPQDSEPSKKQKRRKKRRRK